jgi:PAS domain S-box-containing protein
VDKKSLPNIEFKRQAQINFNGHYWTLIVEQPVGQIVHEQYLAAWFALVGGTLITLLLFMLIRVLLKAREKALILVAKRTKELYVSEKNFKSMVETLPVAIYSSVGIEQVCDYLNPMFVNLFGYSIEEIPTVEHWWPLAYPDKIYLQQVSKDWTKRIQHAIETKSPMEPMVAEVTCKDGSKKNILWGYITGEEKNYLFGIDLTERITAEKAKEDLEKQLVRMEKMEALGLLAGGVAHDLNNVLSGIVSYPELLMMDLPNDHRFRKPLELIHSSGLQASAIVNDLLTLARRGVMATEIVNLNNIIMDYLKSPEHYKLLSDYNNVVIETNLNQNLTNIKGSEIHLRTTIMNLVLNAAEAQASGGKIIISTENQNIDKPIEGYESIKEGEFAVVIIEDKGIGINAKDLQKIFEPFYTKKIMGRSGTGLGMSVVWGTVQDHYGYINVESIENKGTKFYLYFPIVKQQIEMRQEPHLVEEYLGNKEIILIVDDVEEQRQIAKTILKHLNYKVVTVSSGEKAVEYLKNDSCDIILLDMIMDPGIDGLETYQRIKSL